jgi:hypothetical protein
MGQFVLYGPNGLPLIPQTPAVVEPTFSALRTVLKPHETNFPGFNGGQYRAVGACSAIVPAANANLLVFRFAPATGNPIAVLTRLRAHVNIISAVTTQRVDPLVAIAARGYTVAETTNTTVIALGGNNGKMRTGMGSAIAAIVVASAAAGCTGGTRALDTTPFGACPLNVTATALTTANTGVPFADVYKADDHGQHPPCFGGPAGPEGFVVQWGATALATGTVIVTFEVEWLEGLVFSTQAY